MTQDTAAPPYRPAARAGLSPWLTEARALAVLAGPLIVTQLAQMAVMTTDVLLLGRLSTEALAAGAVGNTIYYFAWLIGTGPAFAVSPMVAHILGARPNDRAGVRATVRMALWGSALISPPLMLLMLFGEPILLRLGQTPQVARDAGLFVALLCLGLPFNLGFQVLRNLVTALGRPNSALWVMAGMIAVNGGLAWLLIFGHLGLPALGLAGAGLATAISAMLSFAAMLALVLTLPELRKHRILRRAHRPVWPRFAEVFRLGVPIGLTLMLEAMLFNTMTLLTGTFGTAPLAAHQIALNFASVTFMIPLGVGLASTVRVGLATGAGDRPAARRSGLTAMAMAILTIIPSGLVMAFAGREVAGLYVSADDAEAAQVIVLATRFLLVAAAFQLFDALQVVGNLSLRGLKDAHAPMVVAGLSYWAAGAPVCVWLGVGLDMGGFGVWIGLAFGLAVAAVLMCGRFIVLTRPGRAA